jgi:hypothetical protein
MRAVLIKADADAWLLRTALCRSEVECVWVESAGDVLATASSLQPRLVILQAADGDDALARIRHLRLNGATARLPAIVLRSGTTDDSSDFELMRAGANATISMGADPKVLDPILERLLGEAPRRAARAAVRFEIWGRNVRDEDLRIGWCLNLSVRGLLLATEAPVAVGAHLAFRFDLPNDRGEISGVGQVVRAVARDKGHHSGVEFLVIHGDGRERLNAFISDSAIARMELD